MECPLFIRLPSDIILNINRIDGTETRGRDESFDAGGREP